MAHSCAHEHHHGHSHGNCGHNHSEEDRGSEAQGGLGRCLFPYIDLSHVRGTNTANPPQNVIKPHSQRSDRTQGPLMSDADPEMLIYIPFSHVVKIRGLCLIGVPDGQAPSLVRIYTNRDDLTFDSARRLDPTQELPLANSAEEVSYPLRAGKFTAVSSVTLFFPKNFLMNDEPTGVLHIGFLGEGSDRKVTNGVVIAVYESSPQVRDHRVSHTIGVNADGLS